MTSLKEAWQYLNYCVKEGAISPEDLEDMTDEEVIANADHMRVRGDDYANDNERLQDE